MVRKNKPVTPMCPTDPFGCDINPCTPIVSVKSVNGKTNDVTVVEGKLTQDITTNITIGGVETGTTFNAGTSIDSIIKQLLVVNRTLVSIAITTPPTKTTYLVGESFEPAGMVVKATYSDGNSEVITGYTYSPTGALTVNDTTITVTYGGKTAQQTIVVSTGTMSLYYGNSTTLPTTSAQIEALTLDNTKTKEKLVASGYTIRSAQPSNEFMILAIPKDKGIVCYTIKANGYAVECIEDEVGDYYMYHLESASTGTFRMEYSFEEE